MSKRFENMTKIPQEPAARLLSEANTKLATKLEAPASAMPDAVLAELDEKGEIVDMLRLMSVLLPSRERVWWACLAARDFIGPAPENNTAALAAAEAWVFKPSDENREKASIAIDQADMDDETAKCAMSALYADGKLGVGDLEHQPAPPGASEVMAFAVNIIALGEHEGDFEGYAQMLIDRAVNIARGGNGSAVAEAAAEG
ncbi:MULTISPECIES: hypothetical protein [unclassified Ruegeria]|uniref:DUF6931 family protein n=1 Tax=unclassified Ruegeria TaxID=2625375 RepID=UPI0014897A4B|nr:hypothetical protein [Ruegeria sp. HKCCD8929]